MSKATGLLLLILQVGGFLGCNSKDVLTKITFDGQYIKGEITRMGDAKSIDSSRENDEMTPPYHPNPYSPTVSTTMQVSKEDSVTITYYDLNRKVVCEAYRGYLSPGEYEVKPTDFNANTGIYFIKFTVGNNIFVRKVILVK